MTDGIFGNRESVSMIGFKHVTIGPINHAHLPSQPLGHIDRYSHVNSKTKMDSRKDFPR